MSEWQPIETALKDGSLVWLKNAEHYRPDLLWEWSKGRRQWETQLFTPMRKVRAKWDEKCGAPTEWKLALPFPATPQESQ
jgi:hypothetical protein